MILVTGGTGLVGAHLLLKLTGNGMQVRALYRSTASVTKTKNLFTHYGKQEQFEAIEWVTGDVLDIPSLEDAFPGIDYVYHCAAYISFDPRDEEQIRKTNIEGTANMVNLSLAYGVKKFCHVSSIAALGDTKEDGDTITEETEWNPEVRHGDYALAKYGAEMEVWRAWQEGLKVVIVNPGLIFGYGFWEQGSGAIFRAVARGQYFYTHGTCGMIAVEDVVTIMIALMASDISGERYTLVGENLPYRQLLNAIADGMHKKRPSIEATKLMASIGWRMDWLLSKLLMRKRMLTRGMVRSSYATDKYSNEKILAQTGYAFTPLLPYVAELSRNYPKL
ncbi:NAD-dependent epimerase/dehydratase family protein [Flavobacterium sp. MFBS3-15]|uniref:NAD-dependent epimerase/dehydratase family protein n=1 Tax=Flavobacterium sp. MFBS3-15 TaxID=2989816 RepID=UPI0022354613|nr:NAD-dependent epimerase/dehydratase family protein [Flavobacterium sp. MFBS3-15]MCW4468569.1 NAD-dependent epimerase/dehydratase family protein [Flavobacterium sp. MFBS3-15]